MGGGGENPTSSGNCINAVEKKKKKEWMNRIIQAVTFTTWTRLVCCKSNLHEIPLNIGGSVAYAQNSLWMYISTTSKTVGIRGNKEIIIYGLYI